MVTPDKTKTKTEDDMNGTSKYLHERVERCPSCGNALTHEEMHLDFLFCASCSCRGVDDYSNNHDYIHDSDPLADIIYS